MNKELSARLVEFSEGPVASEFLGMAEETFFADFVAETGAETFSDVEKCIGEYGWLHVFPCLMEFFFSNDYQLSGTGRPDIRWNAIDCFLQEEGGTVTTEERRYLEGLRDSHMSLYRVAEAGPERNLKLYDMVERRMVGAEGRPEMVAKMKQGDTFGIRLVDLAGTKTITAVLLPFEPKTAKNLADDLRDLLTSAMKAIPLMHEGKPLTKRDTEHLIRVMLTPEIATAFMLEKAEDQSFVDTIQALATAKPKRRKAEAEKSKRKSSKAH